MMNIKDKAVGSEERCTPLCEQCPLVALPFARVIAGPSQQPGDARMNKKRGLLRSSLEERSLPRTYVFFTFHNPFASS